jgi:hypothetical protein
MTLRTSGLEKKLTKLDCKEKDMAGTRGTWSLEAGLARAKGTLNPGTQQLNTSELQEKSLCIKDYIDRFPVI